MPALAPPNLFFDLAGRTIANSTTLEPVQVVCSWPLSGQYGVGSRLLYYVLVAACVLARKSEWLRNACLAAALILPAIAAIHAIVLAALHVDDAIDLDIYGALQLCSIGILTAPACVRLSNTYFNSKGRNVLFLWTILVLAGLLALTVEFFRSQSKPCLDDGFGRPLYPGFDFPYDNTTCGLTCTVKDGPFSPMRDGSADNIYVVPVPFVLKFGAATLVAAASCIPGILSTVSIWNKIVKTNSVKRFGAPNADEVIEGTNGATIQGMKSVNNLIRRLLSVVEVPVFGGAVLALIIFGELNFWSKPLHFQSEPPTNIGQWSNICASAFAACGSLYMLLVKYLERVEEEGSMHDDLSHCHCTCHEHGSIRPRSISDTSEMAETSRPPAAVMADDDVRVFRHDTAPAYMLSPTRTETCPDTEEALRGLGIYPIDSNTSTAAASGVTKALVKLATSFGTTSSGRFDDNAFRQGKVTGFPEIPGELNRNSRLNQIKQQWGEPNTDIEDGLTPRGRRSRANSFNGSISRTNSIGPRAPSPNPPPRPPTTGPGTSILGLPTTHSPESTSEPIFPSRPSAEGEKPRSQGTVVTLHEGPNSPAIVLSSDDEPGDWPEPAGTMSGSTEQHSEQTEIPTNSGGLSVPTEGKRDAPGGMAQHGAQRGVQEQQEALPADGQHEYTGEVHVQAPPPTSEEAK